MTAAVRVVSAPHVFVGRARGGGEARAIPDGAIALQGDLLLAVGQRAEVEAHYGEGERLDAVLLPALVNAHTHLELSHLAGAVPGGEGLVPWIERLVAERARRPEPGEALSAAVETLEGAGVAAVGEVTNTLVALPLLGARGFSGTLFLEVFGRSAERIATALSRAERLVKLARPAGGLAIALSPHAVYSTRPSVLATLLRAGPASVHLAEDPGERAFCAAASGPFAELARSLGPPLDAPLGRSAVAVAAPYLSPRTLVVHAVDLDEADREELSRSGATVVLCPRSNLHLGGRLPDLPALLKARIPLAVGTDSLASSPSLSPLAELAVLRSAFPEVAAAALLPLAWNGPAVGAPAVGRLAPRSAPGVLAVDLHGERPGDVAGWLLDACGERGAPLRWVARHRPDAPQPRAPSAARATDHPAPPALEERRE